MQLLGTLYQDTFQVSASCLQLRQAHCGAAPVMWSTLGRDSRVWALSQCHFHRDSVLHSEGEWNTSSAPGRLDPLKTPVSLCPTFTDHLLVCRSLTRSLLKRACGHLAVTVCAHSSKYHFKSKLKSFCSEFCYYSCFSVEMFRTF